VKFKEINEWWSEERKQSFVVMLHGDGGVAGRGY
jgi:hypothetical protein